MKLAWQELPFEEVMGEGSRVRIKEGTPEGLRTFTAGTLEIGRKGTILSLFAFRYSVGCVVVSFDDYPKPSQKFGHHLYYPEKDGWIIDMKYLELIPNT